MNGAANLIPRFFFDFIGRVAPGALVLAIAFIVLPDPDKAAVEAKKLLLEADSPTTLMVISMFAASYWIGTCVGGIGYWIGDMESWFRWIGKTRPCLWIWDKMTGYWSSFCEMSIWPWVSNENPVSNDDESSDEQTFDDETSGDIKYERVNILMPKAALILGRLSADRHAYRVIFFGLPLVWVLWKCFGQGPSTHLSLCGLWSVIGFACLTNVAASRRCFGNSIASWKQRAARVWMPRRMTSRIC